MGYFVQIDPSPPDTDLAAKYHIPRRAEHPHTRCQWRGPDGGECSLHTQMRPAPGGAMLCWFHHPDTAGLLGRSERIDGMLRRAIADATPFESECSPYYYHHVLSYLEQFGPAIDCVIEVGCYMGGFSVLLAQWARERGVRHIIVEFNLHYLLFTWERIVRIDPDAAGCVDCWHGAFPDFVEAHADDLRGASVFIQMDGPHDYTGVVRDLAAARELGDAVHSIACHDTHLRSANLKLDLFVDRAVHAVFADEAAYRPAGFNTGGWVSSPELDASHNALYNKPDAFEGAIISMAEVGFGRDALPRRAPLRLILTHAIAACRSWFVRKWRARGPRLDTRPVDPAEGAEIWFTIEAGTPPGCARLQVGEVRPLVTLGHAFARHRGGEIFRERTDAAVAFGAVSSSCARIEGDLLIGVEPGEAQLPWTCGEWSGALRIEVRPEGEPSDEAR